MKTLLALSALILVSCNASTSASPAPAEPASPSDAAEQAEVREHPAPAPAEMPVGCARDCEQGDRNCLKISTEMFAAYPGEMARVASVITEAPVGVDGVMTLGKNGRLKGQTSTGLFKDFGFTIKPTKRIAYRRTESLLPKIEILPGDQPPRWLLVDPDLAGEWSGALRAIESTPRAVVFDFSGNCLSVPRD